MMPLIKAKNVLEEGGVLLHLTDTIWGLAALADNIIAIDKLRSIKQRTLEKSFILLFANEQMAAHYMPKELASYLNEHPFTTCISSAIINIPSSLFAQDGTLAVRIPKFEQLQQLLSMLGKPIISTSANITGQSSPKTFYDVSTTIKQKVDFILNAEEHSDDRTASKIIKIDPQGNHIVLRP